MSEEPCAVNSLCKQSWTHPLTWRRKKKKKSNQSAAGAARVSSVVYVAAEQLQRQEVSALTLRVFPGLAPRAGGRDKRPSES